MGNDLAVVLDITAIDHVELSKSNARWERSHVHTAKQSVLDDCAVVHL